MDFLSCADIIMYLTIIKLKRCSNAGRQVLIDCTRSYAAHHRYFSADTLKELLENVVSGNVIAFIRVINFLSFYYI